VANGQFDRAPRHQKLVGLYGKQIHQLEPKTEFFNTIGGKRSFAAVCLNGSYAQKAYFAKSRERHKITARVGLARCDAASPKQTLIRCCSIIEVFRSATRDKTDFAEH
jgi:hypothetical protein